MTTSSRTWAIIGVVGATSGATPALVQTANDVGALIAAAGHAVLTGGHHRRHEQSVKYGALDGAIRSTPKHGVVRLIGIVPKGISAKLSPPIKGIQIEVQNNQDALRFVYVHTQLESEDRDAITGQTVDALIALTGKDGTAREVTAALKAGRPVIFLNSLSDLKPYIKADLPTLLLEAKDSRSAVDMALAALGVGTAAQSLQGNFPDLKGEFERAIDSIT